MATKLVDVKFTKAEAKAEAAEYSGSEPPLYPWGLQIRLEDETLSKLGVTEMPNVGDEFHLSVIANVESVSESQMADGSRDRCVCLQITMLGIDLEESAAKEKGEKSTPTSESKETRQPSKGGVMGRS